MAINIIDWLKSRLGPSNQEINIETELFELASSAAVKNLAFKTGINIIGKAVSKCEIKTYKDGKEFRGDNWYRWNISPNKNQSSSVFLSKLVDRLYENNEALVIETSSSELLVADSFHREAHVIKEDEFTDVVIENETFKRKYRSSEVMYFRLSNDNIKDLIDKLYLSYGELIEYAKKAYKKGAGEKGVLNISAAASGKPDFEKTLQQMMQKRFKPYFDADSAVLPLTDGYSYTAHGNKSGSGGSATTRDIRAQIDDVFVYIARALGIPPVLMLGEVADTSKAIDAFLTFCIDPLVDLISEEINRKTFAKEVLNGSYVKIDTKTIKHIDLLSVANSIDKLIGSGCFCINDIREVVGEEKINEEWASQHWMTKNYEKAEEAMTGMKGD